MIALFSSLLLLGSATSLVPTAAQIHKALYPAPFVPVDLVGLPVGSLIDHVTTADGLQLSGIEVAPRADKPTLLIFHGNEDSAMASIRWFAPLIADGYGLVAVEYRQYSGNPGMASEAGLAADADAFYARALDLSTNGKVIVVGHSLGAGVAFGLAARHKLSALVTIGAFTSLAAMMQTNLPAVSVDRYDNETAVASLDEPLYLIHGTADETVPYAQSIELAKTASVAHKVGASFLIEGANHSPDGAVLAMILRAIDAKLESGGATVTVTLPKSVKIIPF